MTLFNEAMKATLSMIGAQLKVIRITDLAREDFTAQGGTASFPYRWRNFDLEQWSRWDKGWRFVASDWNCLLENL
jgi:hypothetical protein